MNISLFYFLHTILLHNAWLGPIVWFFAVPFIYIMMAIVFVFILFKYASRAGITRKAFMALVLSPTIAWLIAVWLKILVHSERPFVALSGVHALFVENDFAFPSGHATTAMALAVAVFFNNKRLGYVCMYVAVLIGIARVIAGVHFPIDIIGGFVLGALVSSIIQHGVKKI